MMPHERINDCDLYYETSGTGPDVIFLHGEDHGIEMFKNQISDLRQDFRCIGYYRRGHGKSQLAPFGYSLHNQVLDLAVLLDYLNSQTTVIVAVAMATTIAASYAVQYPDRVRGLVLASWYELDGYPLMEKRRSKKYSTTFSELHMQMFEIVRDRGEQGLIDHMTAEGDAFLPILPKEPIVRERVMQMMSSHQPEHYIRAAEFYTSLPNLVPRLREVKCPILGICGEDDPCPDDPLLLEGAVNFDQVWIPSARRFAMLESPALFNAALRGFLSRL